MSNNYIPEDFNWKEYTLLNQDLKNLTELQSIGHYFLYGRKENRKYKFENIPTDFNWKDYTLLNSDLRDMTELEAKNHYNIAGYIEKRCYRFDNIPIDFNCEEYRIINDDLKNMTELENANEIVQAVDNSIKKIYIFSTLYTLFTGENLQKYFKEINIECCLFIRDIKNEDIDLCEKDNNLYLFIICPQRFLYSIDNNSYPKHLKILPKNKYILYQTEQLNKSTFLYNSINIISDLINNSYCTFDYSPVNIQYYPENLRDNIKLLQSIITNGEDTTRHLLEAPIILFIGELNERITKILDKLKHRGYNIEIVSKTFGEDLINLIQKSSIVLNLHYYDNAILETFRIHDLLPYNTKILSEKPGNDLEMDLIEKYGDHVVFFPVITDLLDNIDELYKCIDGSFDKSVDIGERKRFIDGLNIDTIESLKYKLNISSYNVVVARYNEDINWTNQFKNVIIYNKGNKIDQYKNVINLENIGREGHTYYKYIYDNYYNLPDYIIFLQGFPFDHSPNIFKNLNNIINKNDFKHFEFLSETLLTCDIYGYPNHPNLPIKEYYKHIFDKEINNNKITFGAGAQFVVSKIAIKNNSREFYLNIVKSLEYSVNPIEVYCLERLHKYIFSYYSLKLVINSNKYYKNPLNTLLYSLKQSNFEYFDNIIIVIGECEYDEGPKIEECEYDEGPKIEENTHLKLVTIKTILNNYDLTGFSQLYKYKNNNLIKADKYFYILDTTTVFKNFNNYFENFMNLKLSNNLNNIYTVPHPNANIHIFEKNVINNYNNHYDCDISKDEGLYVEFNKEYKIKSLCNFGNTIYYKERLLEKTLIDIYKTGHSRIKLIYLEFGVIKYVFLGFNGDIKNNIVKNLNIKI